VGDRSSNTLLLRTRECLPWGCWSTSACLLSIPRGDFGRLGHGDCNDVFLPRPIAALSGRSIVRVACGDTHTLATTAEGRLYSFGRNQNGQLGLGNTNDCILPHLVEALKVLHVTPVQPCMAGAATLDQWRASWTRSRCTTEPIGRSLSIRHAK
jgi:alpha-tubulin suppressor-like RCC1 family protein